MQTSPNVHSWVSVALLIHRRSHSFNRKPKPRGPTAPQTRVCGVLPRQITVRSVGEIATYTPAIMSALSVDRSKCREKGKGEKGGRRARMRVSLYTFTQKRRVLCVGCVGARDVCSHMLRSKERCELCELHARGHFTSPG